MPVVTRACARPGCARPASATLSYDYRGGTVWLESLAGEAHPMTHDLCTEHAQVTSVPRGWQLVDRRVVRPIGFHADRLVS